MMKSTDDKLRIIRMWGFTVISHKLEVGHTAYVWWSSDGFETIISVVNSKNHEEAEASAVNDVYEQFKAQMGRFVSRTEALAKEVDRVEGSKGNTVL